MTSRRTRLATAATTLALGCAGFAGLAAPAADASPATATSASAPSAAAKACDRAPWQARVQGTPHGVGPGSRSGDYLWHNRTGFHLRVTHARHDRRVYSGTIHSSAAMRIDPVRLEKGDVAKLSPSRRTLVFVFSNHGRIDGVNFHTNCAKQLTVSRVHIGSRNLSRKQVYLGHTKAHPAHIPFTVHRMPASHT